jgi:hypothetical protein
VAEIATASPGRIVIPVVTGPPPGPSWNRHTEVAREAASTSAFMSTSVRQATPAPNPQNP